MACYTHLPRPRVLIPPAPSFREKTMKPFKLAVGGSVLVCGTLASLAVHADPPIKDRLPTLADTIVYDTEFATYVDRAPFVQTVKWDHPLIKGCEVAFGTFDANNVQLTPGISRSTMSYGDHIKIYGLDEANDWNAQKGLYNYWINKTGVTEEERQKNLNGIDRKVARANYENFVKTLLGEYRDYPFMVKTKLEMVAKHAPVNKKGAQTAPADQAFLFDSLTGDGYSRLRWIMSEVFTARERKLNPNPTRFNYSWGEVGHVCNRVDNSVKPTSHAEMRYIFATYLQGPGKPFNLDEYEAGLAKFITDHCDPNPKGKDLGFLYDFRGDKNFKASWMECNSFIWNSRHYCRLLETQTKKNLPLTALDYFKRPFATRYARSRELLAAYLFYPSEQHQHLRKASESGGGPHLYVDQEDQNRDGVADFRLAADVMGSGDIGLESQALPSEQINAREVTRTTVSNFSRTRFMRYADWGFAGTFTVNAQTRAGFAADGVFTATDSDADATYKLRMARLNQALDRHTNWGPTHMFSTTMFQHNKRYAVRGAYSPIVAMSYEISKSHNFAVGDFPGTHPKDSRKVKWMFFVKYPAQYYYDERNLKAGDRITWTRSYLNESSLSNDYYHERALDKFGWIPASDMHTAAYLAEADAEDTYWPGSGNNLVDSLNGVDGQ